MAAGLGWPSRRKRPHLGPAGDGRHRVAVGKCLFAAHPNVSFELVMKGSDTAVPGLYSGRADIALMGRPTTPSMTTVFRVP